jgi:amino acid adenylation domain-containing protein
LADLPETVSLPADRVRPSVPSYHGDGVDLRIDPHLWAGVNALAATHNATVSMVLQAVLAVLLQRVGAGEDVVIGAPIAGRLDEALDDLVGFFVNSWVLRVGVNAAHRFSDVLQQVRQKALGAYSNQEVPFERLVEQLNPVRSRAHHPLFQVALVFQNNVGPEVVAIDEVSVEPLAMDTRAAKFDLDFNLGEVPTDDPAAPMAAGVVTYATDLFDRASIERLVTWFGRVIEAVVADASVVVGEVALLDGGERDLVLSGWSGAGVGAPVGVAPQLLAAAVAADADAVAVIDGARELSYRELDQWSTRLARVLIEAGVGPERAVGVAMDRGVELVVTWWAVAKAGGVYVPVDRAHPVERIATVLDAVDAVCVLTCGADTLAGAGTRPVLRIDGLDLSGRCPAPITDADRRAALGADNTAYVMFTSGSTGTPKGVVVSHAGLRGLAAAQCQVYGLGAQSRVLMVAAPTFDASIFDVLWAVGSGATLVVAPPQAYAGEALTTLLHDQRVSAAVVTPAVLATLDRARLDGVDTLVTTGEACPPELVAAWAPGRRMFNGYGPSETTICATSTAPLSAGQPVTIGAPIPGVCALVLDARLNPAPIGVVGELYLGGPALARGYLGRLGLTAERFVANPYGGAGARMYRTGDLVRWTSAGTLDYLGRADTQIKLRGQRIELGEIENTLLACPQISQAAATVHHGSTGDHLIAYISGVPQPDPTVVRQQLSARLPEYMVPAEIVVLEELPLTSSGKIDRRALPAPTLAAAPYRAPQTETEKIVADVFAQVLGVDRVGLDDDFFALGGNSLIATRVSARLELALGTEVPVRYLFDAPTVANLADYLHRHPSCEDTVSVQEVVPVQTLKKGTGVPLFCIHPGGGVSWLYQALGNYLDCPIIGIQQVLDSEEAEPRSIREMAKNYADRIQRVHPAGPYNLLGWSFGGVVAHELAGELQRRGCVVGCLILLDAQPSTDALPNEDFDDWTKHIEALRSYRIGGPEQDESFTYEQIEELIRERGAAEFAAEFPRYQQVLDLFIQNINSAIELSRTHEPGVFNGDAIIFSAVRDEASQSSSLLQSWRPYIGGEITVHSIDCTHQEMLTTESLSMYGKQLKDSLVQVGSTEVSGLFGEPGAGVKVLMAPLDLKRSDELKFSLES